MRKLTYLLSLLLVARMVIAFSSCKEDEPEPTPDAPSVTGPSSITEVTAEESASVDFTVSVPGGFASSGVTAAGGSAAVTADLAADATSGTITVEFTAGATAGAGTVTLTVTDKNGKTGNAQATFTINEDPSVITVTSNITSDVTWTKDKTYILAARVAVEDGATLTIQAGTVIKGQAGQEANATALIVAQGGMIMAQGTASEPIIFTSTADEIVSGQIASPNLPPSQNNLWGGVIILGKAPISVSTNALTAQIEGIPPSDPNGLYGGDRTDDNSGVFQYVSIRHGGTNIGEGNEINGLTLGGVGSGTTIDHIEIIGNQDDGLECFGGTVNISDVIVWGQGDDAYDMDQAYAGTIDNFYYIGGSDSDHGMELDGPEGAYVDGFILRNGTMKMNSGVGEYIDFRDSVIATIENVYFFNASESADVEIDDNGSNTAWKASPAGLDVTGLEFNTSHLSAGNLTIDDIFQDKSDNGDAFTSRAPGATVVTTATVGADITEFDGWSWADVEGEIE